MFTYRTSVRNANIEGVCVTEYVTKFGSLADYDKGRIDLINDQAKNYAFSNIF